ncbi:hypothetical protein HPB49_016839 [Dermacentor silvarum]|uniref:Uncharacterized protein n=1 Tax=Dermacentor silvarum TaxID=543639 RepID=A0ACB8DEI8_DERSI|nr:hypothetical protein HPB49_016839 [Dermacentor silvarum]
MRATRRRGDLFLSVPPIPRCTRSGCGGDRRQERNGFGAGHAQRRSDVGDDEQAGGQHPSFGIGVTIECFHCGRSLPFTQDEFKASKRFFPGSSAASQDGADSRNAPHAMGACSQLKLVLWKNIVLRLRQPVILALELLWPLTIFLLVLLLRKVVPPVSQETCYYNARALPSAGGLPLLQSLICNVDNKCLNKSSYEEIPTYPGSRINELVQDLSPLLQDESILSVIKSLPVLADLLRPLEALFQDETTQKLLGKGLPLTDVIGNKRHARSILLGHTNMTPETVDALLESRINVPAVLHVLASSLKQKSSHECNVDTLSSYIMLKDAGVLQAVAGSLCNMSKENQVNLMKELQSVFDYGKVMNLVSQVVKSLGLDDFSLSMEKVGGMVTAFGSISEQMPSDFSGSLEALRALIQDFTDQQLNVDLLKAVWDDVGQVVPSPEKELVNTIMEWISGSKDHTGDVLNTAVKLVNDLQSPSGSGSKASRFFQALFNFDKSTTIQEMLDAMDDLMSMKQETPGKKRTRQDAMYYTARLIGIVVEFMRAVEGGITVRNIALNVPSMNVIISEILEFVPDFIRIGMKVLQTDLGNLIEKLEENKMKRFYVPCQSGKFADLLSVGKTESLSKLEEKMCQQVPLLVTEFFSERHIAAISTMMQKVNHGQDVPFSWTTMGGRLNVLLRNVEVLRGKKVSAFMDVPALHGPAMKDALKQARAAFGADDTPEGKASAVLQLVSVAFQELDTNLNHTLAPYLLKIASFLTTSESMLSEPTGSQQTTVSELFKNANDVELLVRWVNNYLVKLMEYFVHTLTVEPKKISYLLKQQYAIDDFCNNRVQDYLTVPVQEVEIATSALQDLCAINFTGVHELLQANPANADDVSKFYDSAMDIYDELAASYRSGSTTDVPFLTADKWKELFESFFNQLSNGLLKVDLKKVETWSSLLEAQFQSDEARNNYHHALGALKYLVHTMTRQYKGRYTTISSSIFPNLYYATIKDLETSQEAKHFAWEMYNLVKRLTTTKGSLVNSTDQRHSMSDDVSFLSPWETFNINRALLDARTSDSVAVKKGIVALIRMRRLLSFLDDKTAWETLSKFTKLLLARGQLSAAQLSEEIRKFYHYAMLASESRTEDADLLVSIFTMDKWNDYKETMQAINASQVRDRVSVDTEWIEQMPEAKLAFSLEEMDRLAEEIAAGYHSDGNGTVILLNDEQVSSTVTSFLDGYASRPMHRYPTTPHKQKCKTIAGVLAASGNIIDTYVSELTEDYYYQKLEPCIDEYHNGTLKDSVERYITFTRHLFDLAKELLLKRSSQDESLLQFLVNKVAGELPVYTTLPEIVSIKMLNETLHGGTSSWADVIESADINLNWLVRHNFSKESFQEAFCSSPKRRLLEYKSEGEQNLCDTDFVEAVARSVFNASGIAKQVMEAQTKAFYAAKWLDEILKGATTLWDAMSKLLQSTKALSLGTSSDNVGDTLSSVITLLDDNVLKELISSLDKVQEITEAIFPGGSIEEYVNLITQGLRGVKKLGESGLFHLTYAVFDGVLRASNLSKQVVTSALKALSTAPKVVPVIREKLSLLSEALDPKTAKALSDLNITQDGISVLTSPAALSLVGQLLCGSPLKALEDQFYLLEPSSREPTLDVQEIEELPSKFCRRGYEQVMRMSGGPIIWGFLKPILRGQILYAPKSPAAFQIMQEELIASKSLQPLAKDMLGDDVYAFLTDLNVEDLRHEFGDLGGLLDLVQLVGSISQCFELDRFKQHNSEEDLVKAAMHLAVVFLNLDTNMGLRLENGSTVKSLLPPDVQYKIRMDIDNVPLTKTVKSRFWQPGANDDFLDDMRYLRGFAHFQELIDKAITKMHVGKSFDYPPSYLQQFPYPCYIKDS